MAWFCSSFSFISWPKRADKSHKTSFILSISTIKSRWSDLKDSCHSDVSHTNFSSGFSLYERVYRALVRVETQYSMGLWQVFLPSLLPVPSPLPQTQESLLQATSSLGLLIFRHVEGSPWGRGWNSQSGWRCTVFFKNISASFDKKRTYDLTRRTPALARLTWNHGFTKKYSPLVGRIIWQKGVSELLLQLLNVRYIHSLSVGPLKPGHQCPCLKSLIARPNFPWKNIKIAHFEAKRKLYKLSGQERVN